MTPIAERSKDSRRAPGAVNAAGEVALRRAPFPYQALLAVCSDLDETPDWRVYREISRFLNTTEATAMGPGVGLEVGNTIYFDMPADQFAYWNTDDAGRAMVRALIRSGHIDCLHSFGDLATTRSQVARSLDELQKHDCRLEVWIDHGTAATNFGADIMRGSGDLPAAEAYHADLTCDFGVEYVWRGRVTSVIGQDVPASLGGLFNVRHPLASSRTIAKETAKHLFGRLGTSKYGMHAPNRVLRRSRLRDGRPVYEFLRSNPHWGGVSSCDTGRGIGRVLTDALLNRLVDRGGACVLYTHLGKVWDPRRPFSASALDAFRQLATACRDGKILVTTSRRLLGFCRASREVQWDVRTDGGGVCIDLSCESVAMNGHSKLPCSDLAGLTFYVPDPDRARIRVNGKDAPGIRRNGPDHTGQRSVSLPWERLEFPNV